METTENTMVAAAKWPLSHDFSKNFFILRHIVLQNAVSHGKQGLYSFFATSPKLPFALIFRGTRSLTFWSYIHQISTGEKLSKSHATNRIRQSYCIMDVKRSDLCNNAAAPENHRPQWNEIFSLINAQGLY